MNAEQAILLAEIEEEKREHRRGKRWLHNKVRRLVKPDDRYGELRKQEKGEQE